MKPRVHRPVHRLVYVVLFAFCVSPRCTLAALRVVDPTGSVLLDIDSTTYLHYGPQEFALHLSAGALKILSEKD